MRGWEEAATTLSAHKRSMIFSYIGGRHVEMAAVEGVPNGMLSSIGDTADGRILLCPYMWCGVLTGNVHRCDLP